MSLTNTAPYASVEPTETFLEKFRETGLGGGPITISLLGKLSINPEVARRVIHSLRELELIDDDSMPTENLAKFEKAPSDQYRQVFGNLLLDYYAPVFMVLGMDTSKWTPTQVEDQFRELTPKTLRGRMAKFFLGICEYAGIINLDSVPLKKRGPQVSAPRVPRKTPTKSAKAIRDDGPSIDDSSVSDPIGVKGASESLTANLSSGGVLLVALSGRVADLNSSEREFVFAIFDQVKAFGVRPALGVGSDANNGARENLSETFKNGFVR